MTATQFRTCPLCEATCGLSITMNGDRIQSVRGDDDDVFSHGFICPKGTAVKHLQEDPDRLRAPLIRDGETLREANWEEAFAAVERGLGAVIERGGKDAVALYAGNPSVHSLSATVMLPMLIRALGSKNFYSAASVDQIPKHVSCGLMFGDPLLIPVPDLDRTDYLLVLGANPWISNGSLATAPDFRGRLEAIGRRGGKVVVIDPRRTETATGADEHLFIKPGTDAFLVLALAHTLFDEGRVDLGDLEDHVTGLADIERIVEPFTPEAVAARTGIAPDDIRRIAREFSDAPSASIYDRVGVHQHTFGTLTSWASDVVNAITGNLDRAGGRMFPLAAHAQPDPEEPRGRGWSTGRFSSRVKGYPEAFGQLPVATLADEIEEPGDGQVRALVTIAGNPVLSTPNGRRVAAALSSLDFMVAVDPYVNETTRLADVILPPPPLLSRHHYDFAFYQLSIRNVANYSPPLQTFDGPDEWEILARLALVMSGGSAAADPHLVPAMGLQYLIDRAVRPGGPLEGHDPGAVATALEGREPVEQILDLRLRSGPYGDRFGDVPDGLSLAVLEANPHGVDLGPLTPRLPNALRTVSGKVELAPEMIAADIPRLLADLERPADDMVLIGRRQLRSNNSWMHNVPAMVRGSNRCTLVMNPADAARLALSEGAGARIVSRVGEVVAAVEVSDEMMPGVASLPHGWGHDLPGVRLSVAGANAGVSANDLTDDALIDPLSGNAALNALPVTITPAEISGNGHAPGSSSSGSPSKVVDASA
ncbi:MAG: molybdopterin-dependent oxidoreductase [Actinobacteria bacterium]|nr:molybdopterin-dependent oxidoreductase [Actinomycetota bacterium]